MQIMLNAYRVPILFFLICLPYSSIQAQLNFHEKADVLNCNDEGHGVGIAIADFNKDGYEDMYVIFRNSPDILYKNIDGAYFENVSDLAGIKQLSSSQAAVWGDFDNDGNIDLFVASQNKGKYLYRNNGDESFTELAFEAGVQTQTNTTSIGLADVDRDGLVDIYLANLGEENTLYRNNGNFSFTNYIYLYGATDDQISMGMGFFDIDNDKDADLYLSHDANQNAILYKNNGSGYFENVASEQMVDVAKNGMALDVGDLNNDGWLDLYLANLGPNNCFLNQEGNGFLDASSTLGLDEGGMGWGINIFDYDNDGHKDIYLANDSYFAPFPNVLFQNLGADSFHVVSENTLLASMAGSYGTAIFDYNNDGLEDLFICNTSLDDNLFFENQTIGAGNWISIQLEGVQTNRSAIGTKVKIEAGDLLIADEVMAGSGWASQNSLSLHFGLGEHQNIDRITIYWPNSEDQVIENISVNQFLKIKEAELTSDKNIKSQNDNLIVYPNPVHTTLNLKNIVDPEPSYTLYIFTANGKFLYQTIVDESMAIDISHLSNGLYFLRSNLLEQNRVIRFVKQ